MQESAATNVAGIAKPVDIPKGQKADGVLRKLIMLYVWGSVAAVVTIFFLVWVGLEFTAWQWLSLVVITPFAVLIYLLIDIYLIIRHFRPIRSILARLDAGDVPTPEEISPAVARALNLQFYSFIRVTFIHGPGATLAVFAGLLFGNIFLDANFATWQIAGVMLTVLFFASPAHAIFEYFGISRVLAPVYVRLWKYCPRLVDVDRESLVSIKLKQKLLYLAVFLTALPLLFLAISIVFKVELLLTNLGIDVSFQHLGPLLLWVSTVVIVCMLGALIMAVLTASEVSGSATRMIKAMHEVEEGELEQRLFITTTDEYKDLYRGFNLMTGSLREEVQFLEVTQDLSGELNLDRLIKRIMTATTELLDSERSTLFVYDRKTDELWSRFAEGMDWRPLPATATASIVSSSPPTCVQARPVTWPILFSC